MIFVCFKFFRVKSQQNQCKKVCFRFFSRFIVSLLLFFSSSVQWTTYLLYFFLSQSVICLNVFRTKLNVSRNIWFGIGYFKEFFLHATKKKTLNNQYPNSKRSHNQISRSIWWKQQQKKSTNKIYRARGSCLLIHERITVDDIIVNRCQITLIACINTNRKLCFKF